MDLQFTVKNLIVLISSSITASALKQITVCRLLNPASEVLQWTEQVAVVLLMLMLKPTSMT